MVNPKKSSSSDLAPKSAKVKSQPAKGLADKHLSLTGEKKRMEMLLFAPATRTRRAAPNPNGAADANNADGNGAGPNNAGAGVAD